MKKNILSITLAIFVLTAMISITTIPVLAAGYYETIPLQYDEAKPFSEGLAPVKLNGKWGYIDQTGKSVIPFLYDQAFRFSEGLAYVSTNGETSFIDTMGKNVIILNGATGDSTGFKGGVAIILKPDQRTELIDKTGKVVVSADRGVSEILGDGFASVFSNSSGEGKYGVVDMTGKKITDIKYDYIFSFNDGLALVTVRSADGIRSYGFIDKTGIEVIPTENSYGEFSEGLVNFFIGNSMGYIDKDQNVVINWEYGGQLMGFHDDLAAVRSSDSGKWGFIDKTGVGTIPAIYDDLGSWWETRFDVRYGFSDGYAAVVINGKYGFINTDGDEIVPLKYDCALNFSGGLAAVQLNGRWGFIAIVDIPESPTETPNLNTADDWAKTGIQ